MKLTFGVQYLEEGLTFFTVSFADTLIIVVIGQVLELYSSFSRLYLVHVVVQLKLQLYINKPSIGIVTYI